MAACGGMYRGDRSRVRRRDALTRRADEEVGEVWRAAFAGIGMSLALWTMALALGAALR